jgi:hypothetical protein
MYKLYHKLRMFFKLPLLYMANVSYQGSTTVDFIRFVVQTPK